MLTLSACSKTPALLTPPPANLMTECPPPAPFEGTTADDLVTDHLDLLGLYRECATRHNALVNAL
ncbi:hypothetical protein GobsT_50950 [Gemmata obscuriglobus]|nr:hypothetical protein GobsT_50950 [Gemmata obscuriglobus]VTS09615.1 unnamed protein product [Gemmata obscuriglobus UQM 2246]